MVIRNSLFCQIIYIHLHGKIVLYFFAWKVMFQWIKPNFLEDLWDVFWMIKQNSKSNFAFLNWDVPELIILKVFFLFFLFFFYLFFIFFFYLFPSNITVLCQKLVMYSQITLYIDAKYIFKKNLKSLFILSIEMIWFYCSTQQVQNYFTSDK